MPFENKELSRAWKIVFIKTVEEDETENFKFLVERVESRVGGKHMSIKIVISKYIIENKLKTMGHDLPPGYDAPDRFHKIVLDNEKLFIEKWCLIKIEQSINDNSLETELPVDAKWIKDTEEGHLKPLSRQQDRNTYIYIPEKRIIGFQ